MVGSRTEKDEQNDSSEYDRKSEVHEFDDSKTGVKGLLDAGVTKLPRIFLHNQYVSEKNSDPDVISKFSIPIVDFQGLGSSAAQRADIVRKIKDACENWGFFQIVHHEIPSSVMGKLLKGVRHFHEQDAEAKKEFYSRDITRKVTPTKTILIYSNHQQLTGGTHFTVLRFIPSFENKQQNKKDIIVQRITNFDIVLSE